jgi:hypothetical protein
MKVRLWVTRLVLTGGILTLTLLVFVFSTSGPKKTNSFKGVPRVTIVKEDGRYTFKKDGQRFLVKGGAGFTHIKELAASGGNTMICWDTSKLESTLREAAQHNVAVIIGLDIPGGEKMAFYDDEKNVKALVDGYLHVVRRYKDHPALLAWCLGNELEVPLSFTVSNFYKTYNRILSQINNIDPHHPVSTAIINASRRRIMMIQWRMPGLDFFCLNTYNSIRTIQQSMNTIKLVWDGPYLIGEWAPNGGWEAEMTIWNSPIENTSTKKAEQFYELCSKYMPINDPRFLGSVAYYWGSRPEQYTYTWFSIFNEDGTPTEVMETLNDCWKDTVTKHQSPKLRFMLIDSMGARDNIMLSQGSKHKAEILLEAATSTDSLKFSWQILKDNWLYWGQTWNYSGKPPAEYNLMSDSTSQSNIFIAPSRQGPYRVFVTVYNSKGYCATANTPFYVVE